MQLQAHKDAIALSDKRRLEADLRKRDEDVRMLMRRMAAIEEERAVWAARTGAATVKTEHGEGDVDEPKTKDDKMPDNTWQEIQRKVEEHLKTRCRACRGRSLQHQFRVTRVPSTMRGWPRRDPPPVWRTSKATTSSPRQAGRPTRA